MARPRALVLRTAGTNCERETVRALELAGAEAEALHTHVLMADPARLDSVSMIVLAGGFSYGDDVAAGRVWGHELRTHIGRELRAFVADGGFALGVCNGFQALVESGLLSTGASEPGAGLAFERDFALSGNASNHYECRWVELQTADTVCPFVVAGERFPVPVAHAEGRFVVKDEATLERLRTNRQIAFTYVDAAGADDPSYPADPNGSAGHIAGICDPSGRVLGLMPHPERNLSPWNHPKWTRLPRREAGEGLTFYRRMVETAAAAPV